MSLPFHENQQNTITDVMSVRIPRESVLLQAVRRLEQQRRQRGEVVAAGAGVRGGCWGVLVCACVCVLSVFVLALRSPQVHPTQQIRDAVGKCGKSHVRWYPTKGATPCRKETRGTAMVRAAVYRRGRGGMGIWSVDEWGGRGACVSVCPIVVAWKSYTRTHLEPPHRAVQATLRRPHIPFRPPTVVFGHCRS